MVLKDYYSILGLPPNAAHGEIKRAYRKLAMKHHPDRNLSDPYAEAHFHEIREAYETLIDPTKKDHYLQQRWYYQSLGKKFTDYKPVTPETILNDAIQLNKYVRTLNVFRVDKEGLATYIHSMISKSTIDELKKFNDTAVNVEIIKLVMDSTTPLNDKQVSEIAKQLRLLAPSREAIDMINSRERAKKSSEYLDRSRLLIMLIIAIAICLFIWLAVK